MGKPAPRPTPHQIHLLEQRWAFAEQMLDGILGAIQHDIPVVADVTGLSDGSMTFDYVHAFIVARQMQGEDPRYAVFMCAAAITRLARASRADNDLLAQLDKEIKDDNEH